MFIFQYWQRLITIFSKVKFVVSTRNYFSPWQSSMREQMRQRTLLHIYISFIFGIHIYMYVATIHNATEETSSQKCVSTIKQQTEREKGLQRKAHDSIRNYLYLILIHYNYISRNIMYKTF